MIFTSSVGDDLFLARNFYSHKNYKNALEHYRNLLGSDLAYIDFGNFVIEASLCVSGVSNQISFIQEYLEKAPRLYDIMLIYNHLALLNEYLFNYEESIKYYQLAYKMSRPLESRFSLRAAKLNFELGEYMIALDIIKNIYEKIEQDDEYLYSEVLMVMVRSVLALSNDLVDLEKIIQTNMSFIQESASSSLLYLLYLSYFYHREDDKSKYFMYMLLEKYPHSPESLELKGLIKRAVLPSLLWW